MPVRGPSHARGVARAAVATLALWVCPAVADETTTATAVSEPHAGWSLWLQPLDLMALGIGVFTVSGGAQVDVARHVALVLEAGVTIGTSCGGPGGWMAVGAQLHPATAGQGGWPFVQPKLVGDVARGALGLGACGPPNASWPAELGAGFDLGYQWRFERATVALVLGIVAGFTEVADSFGQLPLTTSGLGNRSPEVRGGYNAHLLRVGLTW